MSGQANYVARPDQAGRGLKQVLEGGAVPSQIVARPDQAGRGLKRRKVLVANAPRPVARPDQAGRGLKLHMAVPIDDAAGRPA